MVPIGFDGDGITAITMDGDTVTEVTMDGDVVWTSDGDPGDGNGGGTDWRSGTTVLENFEGYSSQADLESEWDFGVAPAVYELNTEDPIAHDQDVRAVADFAHAPNTDLSTAWGNTYSVVVTPGHTDNSPGLSVQHQPNWNSRLDDCYWTRADFREDELRIAERVNGSTTELVTDAFPSALSSANTYRIQVDLDGSNDQIRARLYDYGQDPSETPHSNTGYVSVNTVHTGGHIMLDSGREGSSSTEFDNIREH